MIEYDYEAIFKSHPNVAVISADEGVWDKDENKVELDQAKIDAARVELNKLAYKQKRQMEYPDYGTQLDYIYHNGIDKWKTDIVDPVKAKYPKPE